MVETLSSGGRWNIALVRRDLIEKAGLNEDEITWEISHLAYQGRRMRVSHSYGQHLVVSMEGKEDEDFKKVMDSFTKIVEYHPFCRYDFDFEAEGIPAFPTYEWDRVNSNSRFSELESKANVSNLRRV